MFEASNRAWRHARGLWGFLALLAAALFVLGVFSAGAHEEGPSDAYLFWRTGCPYCEDARAYLRTLKREIPDLTVTELEVSGSEANREIFIVLNMAMEIERPAVPLVVVGGRAIVGYLDDRTTGAAIREAVLRCRAEACPNIMGPLLAAVMPVRGTAGTAGDDTAPDDSGTPAVAPTLPETITLPLIGAVPTGALSLPALTVLLGAVDGFNPCAMWVLVFLIGLLVGLKDHRRMWLLGGAFLLASAAVYFLFMAAWLNVLLFLGALLWIRLAVGLLALGGGAFYLREFVVSSDAVCKVAPPERRRRIMDGLKRAVREQRLPLALIGVVVLAFAVNLIELLCSAGIPAVYTQVLAMTPLPAWQYSSYLLLYIAVFLLDDLVVFATAMATLQVTGLTAKYSRYSHLIGGVVLCAIGALLLLRPEWLTFG